MFCLICIKLNLNLSVLNTLYLTDYSSNVCNHSDYCQFSGVNRIEVPKCINQTKFLVKIRDKKETECLTNYVSSGNVNINPIDGNINLSNETYIFKVSDLGNCATTTFDTLKLKVWMETISYYNFFLCPNKILLGLVKIFTDEGSTYVSSHPLDYDANFVSFTVTLE